MNFKLDSMNLNNKKIQCILQNGHKSGGSYIIDNEYIFFINPNLNETTQYNKSIEKKITLQGENIYYPLDEYLLNVTYVFNATLFDDIENPFDKRTWPGDWESKPYVYKKVYEQNSTVINYQLLLVRASVDKTLFNFFYPSFFMIIGIISLLDITENKGKYGMYITLFLSIVSTLIFIFSKMPAKSGLNLVIITTIITTYILIFIFINDVFVDKFKGQFNFKLLEVSSISSYMIIIFHIAHLYGLLIYPWMDKINFIRYITTNILSLNIFPLLYTIAVKYDNNMDNLLKDIKKRIHPKVKAGDSDPPSP
jgi:hypothetical protein